MKLKMMLIAATLVATAYGATYENGMYRGNFIDKGANEITLEFQLKDDIVIKPKYRHLTYKGEDFLKNEKFAKVKEQYLAVLKNAEGKNVVEAMREMYAPDKIENAGASVRSDKVRSAMKDGLLHDPYALEGQIRK